MDWLLISTIAYLILAFVNVVDKFILKSVVPGPKTYTFLVGVTGLVVVLAAPWFLHWPGLSMLLFDFLAGAFFAGGLFYLYSALKEGEASRIFTMVGGAVPIFTVLLSLLFFKEAFTGNQWTAIVFLILGTMVISRIVGQHDILFYIKRFLHFEDDNKWHSAGLAIVSALMFALFWVATKYAYNHQEFASAFIWIRIGTFLTVLVLLIKKESRDEIFAEIKNSNKQKNNKYIYMGAQGFGALGTILQNYAVSLGSVALVTSLQGLQYGLLLVFTTIGSILLPKIIKEYMSKSIVIQKAMSIILIGIGLYFLAI